MAQEIGYVHSLVKEEIGKLTKCEQDALRHIEHLQRIIKEEEDRLSEIKEKKKDLMNYLWETGHTPPSKL